MGSWMRMSLSDFTPQFARSLHGRPRVDKIDSRILEIAHVACHQHSTARVGYGGDLAVGLSDRPTRKAAAGCNLCVGSAEELSNGRIRSAKPRSNHRLIAASSAFRRLPIGMIATP